MNYRPLANHCLSRVGQLEQKLESIVTLLSQTRQDPPPQHSPHMNVCFQPSRFLSDTPSETHSTRNILPSPPKSLGGSPASIPPLPPPSTSQLFLELDLTVEEQELRLEIFRTEMAIFFPFVRIPASLSAYDVREQKPFFFATIMLAASSRSAYDLRTTGNKLLEYLGMRMLVHGEKSLDLLQGIMVYIAWFVFRQCLKVAHSIEITLNLVPQV
jgi:hypothetical protein